MSGNPYSSKEPGLGPLMRDIKNKICTGMSELLIHCVISSFRCKFIVIILQIGGHEQRVQQPLTNQASGFIYMSFSLFLQNVN